MLLPVVLSVMTTASSMVPYGSKYDFNVSSPVLKGSPPTKIFVQVVSFCLRANAEVELEDDVVLMMMCVLDVHLIKRRGV